MPEIMTKDEALAAGERYFFTGKPCKRNHISKRYVQNGSCVECLHPKTTTLAVISTPGEIVVAEQQPKELSVTAIQRQQALEIQARKVTLAEQKLTLALANRAERTERRERSVIKKSQLIDVIVFSHPLDYETVVTMLWGFAVMHDPRVKREDVIGQGDLKDCRYGFRCFPEDKAQILELAREMFSKRQDAIYGPVQPPTPEQIAALLNAETQWPEGDPR